MTTPNETNKMQRNMLINRMQSGGKLSEVTSKFLADVTALAKKCNGWTPTAKADYLVCVFDDEGDGQDFWRALESLHSKYPEMDIADDSNDGCTIKVAETGF